MAQRHVVVLGGGIAGLSVAWQLARRGQVRVTLLERAERLATQASARNAAIFRTLDDDPVAVELAIRSRALFDALDAPRPILTRTGGLYMGPPAELAALRVLAERHGLAIEPLDRAAIVALVPALADGDARDGLFVPGDGVLDIQALCDALAAAARAASATLLTGATVTALLREGARVTGVTLADGSVVPADDVVIAGGAWAEELGATCGTPLPLRPVRRHLAVLQRPPGVPVDAPVVWRLGQEVYFRPHPDGILASPCDEEPWAPTEEPPASPAAQDALASLLAGPAPALAQARTIRAWACLRTFAPDRALVAGPDPRLAGLHWIAGLGGRGMTCGVALGELVAEGLSGGHDPLASAVAPDRLLAPPLRGLVLDLDGTLADTLDDLGSALNHVLTSFGLPERARDEVRRFIGDGAANLVLRALPEERAELADVALAAFRTRYGENMLVATRAYPGVTEALAALHVRGVPMAVLSNKPQAMTEAIVRALFGDIAFVAIAGERPGVPRKPDPTAALAQVAAMGLVPEQVALVGDGTTDMATAVAAGMRAIGVEWGFRSRAELVSAGAQRILSSPQDLLRLCD